MCLQVRFSFDEPDFAMIDTLFSLAEAHLFMQLVELQDSRPDLLPSGKAYPDLYRCAALAHCCLQWTAACTAPHASMLCSCHDKPCHGPHKAAFMSLGGVKRQP